MYNGRIFVFHQGGGSNGQLWYSVFDGSDWGTDTEVPITGLSAGPSAVTWDGKIFVFHQGAGDEGNLWYNVFDGRGWRGDVKVEKTRMPYGPSAVVYRDRV